MGYLPFGYKGPCRKLFQAVWLLSIASLLLFVFIRLAALRNYGKNDLAVGILLVALLLLALAIAGLATLLNLILICFPEVSFETKCGGWLSVALVWASFLILSISV